MLAFMLLNADVVAKHGKIANRFNLCTHGYYIKKRLYLGSKLPSWIRKIAPESGLYVREEYWNAFPYTFCRYESEFTSRIGMTIESMHFDNDRGMRNHVFGSPQPKHEVVTVDIAAQSVTKKGGGVYQGDPATHKFPLSPGWIETREPIMGSYKLSSMFFNIPFFPMAERAARAILDISVKDLAIHAHRNLYCWQDDWMWMNANQVRAFESHVLEKTAANDIASICIPLFSRR